MSCTPTFKATIMWGFLNLLFLDLMNQTNPFLLKTEQRAEKTLKINVRTETVCFIRWMMSCMWLK